jgi:hypothetical protein
MTWEIGELTPGTRYTCATGGCLTPSEMQWTEPQHYTCQVIQAENHGWVMNSALEFLGVLTVVTIVVVSIIVICKAIGNTFTLLERHEQLRDTLNDQISDLSAKIDQFMNAKTGTKP